jgi:hypothetical protein
MVTRWDRYVVDERATNEVARPSSELQGCRSKLGSGDEQPVEQQDLGRASERRYSFLVMVDGLVYCRCMYITVHVYNKYRFAARIRRRRCLRTTCCSATCNVRAAASRSQPLSSPEWGHLILHITRNGRVSVQ